MTPSPVGLKEVAIDSPTSRATAVHISDQIDFIEKWLEDYMKSTSRLIAESSTLENVLNHFTSHAMLPNNISETLVDHDYTLLAMRRYTEGAKDFWMSMLAAVKKLNVLIVEPVRLFLVNDLRACKDARRLFEQAQKHYDSLQTKYASQGKSKEPSSLREDAFQLHEARKQYLKCSMDFYLHAPQLRYTLDKLLVKIFSDQWREMRVSHENTTATFGRSAQEMERVKGWAKEMENGANAFRRELFAARKQLEEAAESSARPSRELDDYAMSTVPYLGGHAHSASGVNIPQSPERSVTSKADKQGWLYLRTYTGKPTRTAWIRRWAFVRSGIFGWLLQGPKPGGVEESERIGVLLCNVRPAVSEERRFCFEVKTNKNAIMLQAETQDELTEWISVFEKAKSKAVENPASLGGERNAQSDPAFSISNPPVPEFGTTVLDFLSPGGSDEAAGPERTSTLPAPEADAAKESTDMLRRSTMFERDEVTRDATLRLKSKLDIYRKPVGSQSVSALSTTPGIGGGIATLIAASHGSMPVGPSVSLVQNVQVPDPSKPRNTFKLALRDMPPSSLAPSTLADPPAPTNMSKAAVVVMGERGISGDSGKTGGIPNGMMANIWGSSNWGFVNRLERGEINVAQDAKPSKPPSPPVLQKETPMTGSTPLLVDESSVQATASTTDLSLRQTLSPSRSTSPSKQHRNTISLGTDSAKLAREAAVAGAEEFPNYYPIQLKTQDAQFHLLFPSVKRYEKLVLVFRATWNPNDQQEFPGRVYVTSREIYFFSNHLGLVLTSVVGLASIDEVTAAPGRDCDFLFLHLKEPSEGSHTRITIKTFLEPLKLLQRRLNFLVQNAGAEEPHALEAVIKILIKMEQENSEKIPSLESWEDNSYDTPADHALIHRRGRSFTDTRDLKAPIRVDRSLGLHHMSVSAQGQEVVKFKLPAHAVHYVPAGNLRLAAEHQFDVSPKALFHVLFGDRSAVWQLLQHERRARNIQQGPWVNMGGGYLRREFDFVALTNGWLGRAYSTKVKDYQVVEVNNDHLCYVVTDKRTAWYLPFSRNYRLLSKIVITHVAKSKCNLAIFTKVEWLHNLIFMRAIIEKQALDDLDLDALDLIDLVTDQVRKLGFNTRTKRALQIFGQLGQSAAVTKLQVDGAALDISLRRLPEQQTVWRLLTQTFISSVQSVMTSIVSTLLDVLGWIWKTSSAHTMILGLLVISALLNGFYTSRDSWEWYHERNAGKFMARLGIGPNHAMSKAVYLGDLDEVLGHHGEWPVLETESSSCYSKFHETHQLEDLDAPLSTPGLASGVDAPLTAPHHLQRTRQRQGGYRHKLLVAMRVVNSIEKEVVQSEWEAWVRGENRRCLQLGALLKEDKARNQNQNQNQSQSQSQSRSFGDKVLGRIGKVEAGEARFKEWFEDYCGSCGREGERLAVR